MEKRFYTAESVTEGHPDKICDQISDAILDELIKKDPNSRVACETCVTTGLVLVMGEITTTAYIDIPGVVRNTIKEIGYTDSTLGFDGNTCAVVTALDEQSPDIAMGVEQALEVKENGLSEDEKMETGAGDQGMMYGYATNETEELMPYPITLAHKLAYRLSEVRKQGILNYLRPDGKTQVTVEYDENDMQSVSHLFVETGKDFSRKRKNFFLRYHSVSLIYGREYHSERMVRFLGFFSGYGFGSRLLPATSEIVA